MIIIYYSTKLRGMLLGFAEGRSTQPTSWEMESLFCRLGRRMKPNSGGREMLLGFAEGRSTQPTNSPLKIRFNL